MINRKVLNAIWFFSWKERNYAEIILFPYYFFQELKFCWKSSFYAKNLIESKERLIFIKTTSPEDRELVKNIFKNGK